MFTTSGDILNFSIALAVIAVAVFLCWSLYYLINNLRRIDKISKQVENVINKSNSLIDLLKRKINQSGSYLFLAGKLVEKAMDYFNNKKNNRTNKSFQAKKETSPKEEQSKKNNSK